MNQEIKVKWLAALRSGKYQQGKSKLRSRDDKFCCLGVLCDVLAPTEWASPATHINDRYSHDNFGGTLSYYMQSRADIGHATANHLAGLNDAGKTFAEIADHIEKTL